MKTNRAQLTDFTFLLSFRIDSADRLENLIATVGFLATHTQSNIRLLEAGPKQMVTPDLVASFETKVEYSYLEDNEHFFYRTYYNNLLINLVSTPYFVLYDADVILPPDQLLEAAKKMRTNAVTAIYPYDGRFYETDKYVKKRFINSGDFKFLEAFSSYHKLSFTNSYGGVVMLNKVLYEKCGLENLMIRGWGPDDIERVRRIRIMGLGVERTHGPLFHLYHERNQMSMPQYSQDNRVEYFRICSLTRSQMIN